METLFLIVPIALLFVFIAVKVLFWAINSGQYDDLETEAHKILFDHNPEPKKTHLPSDNSAVNGAEQDAGASKKSGADK